MADLQIAHLSWIRKPIAQSVEQAKLAMENYAARKHELNNPPSGAQPAWIANKKEAVRAAYAALKELIEQVHCSVSMVACKGASALSQELLVLCSNIELQDLNAEEESRALMAIQAGLLVLPGYLKMVIDGSPDNAGILAKYINDVREIRNVPLMAGDNLLPSNLSFVFSAPPARLEEIADDARQSAFASAGSEFQKGFAEFIGSQSKSALERMRVVLAGLIKVTRDIEVSCAWWVGERLLAEMQSSSVKPASNTLSNIRMLSVAVQKLSSGGERAAREAMGIERFKAILYALSLAVSPDSETQELLHKFNIGPSAGQEEVQKLQSKLEASQAESLDDVVSELKPHLETGMVSLGRALSAKSEKGFQTQMEVFTTSMKIIANVFSMIGEDPLAASTNAMLASVIDIKTRDQIDDALIEQIKTQVLFIDQQLSQLEANDATKALMIEGISADVITALVYETQKEIISVRKKISIHVESGIEADSLIEGIESLASTATAFAFSGGVNISNLLKGVASALVSLVEDRRLTNSDSLDQAARALVAVEMYFDALINDLAPDRRLLAHAEKALSGLGVSIEHIQTISRHDLLMKFDEGIGAVDITSDEDPFVAEIFELRLAFEAVLSNPELQKYQNYKSLYEASSRLSMAAQIAGLPSLSELCSALASMAKIAPGQVDDPFVDTKAVQGMSKEACEMVIRSMDEYSTKGSISLFLRTITDALNTAYGEAGPTAEEDSKPGTSASSEADQQSYPPGFDPMLISLFRQEADEQYEKLIRFVDSKSHVVTDVECRAVHTLNGISGSAGCDVLKRVYEALEHSLQQLAADGTELTAAKHELLAGLLGDTREFQLGFPWETDTAHADEWVDAARSLGLGTAGTPELRQDLVVPNTASHLPEAVTSQEPVEEDSNQESQHNHSHANAFGLPTAPATVEIEYNLEMASFYLDDAEELLPALVSHVDAWYGNMSNKDLNDEIKRNMHTLKGAAGIAEAKCISDLTHNMESLFESFELGILEPDQDAAEIVRLVLDNLQSMTEAVRGERAYDRPLALIEFLESAVANNKIDLAGLNVGLQNAAALEEAVATSFQDSNPEPELQQLAPARQDEPESPSTEVSAPDETAIASSEADGPATKPKTRRGKRGSRGRKTSVNAEASEADDVDILSDATQQTERLEPSPTLPIPVPQLGVSEVPLPAENDHQQEEPAKRNFMSVLIEEDLIHESHGSENSVLYRGPIESNKVISMLDRLESKLSQESGGQRKKGSAEKIKVDQRLLETAVVQASELNASRHRQQAQHEEAMLMLTSLREKLSLHLLDHNQFTNALRGYINQPSTLQSATDHSELQLERFNYLSSMHVQSGVHIAQMFQDVEDIFEQNVQIQASYSEQAALIRSLQRDLLDSRLVPFMNIRQALQSVVDQTGKSVGKAVKSEFVGADTIVDKVLLESIRDPLTHIIKNAIDHGLEDSAERLAHQKDEQGTVVVSVSRRGKSVFITVKDDGRGIDPEVIRKKAIEKKIIKADANLTHRELLHLITANGFTTTDKVTTISGRGVGMDIVKAAVERIGGMLSIDSVIGEGTTFTMELPFTIGSNRAVVCQAGEQWFAIPSYNMTQIVEFSVAELEEKRRSGKRPQLEFDYASYDIVHLSELIAMPELRLKKQSSVMTTLILCAQGETKIAIEVDKGGSMPEIHVRKLEGILSRLKGIIGEAAIHDGSPVLVLDVMELARHNLKLTESGYQVRLNRVRNIRRDDKPHVLVVDDASSYRKLLSKHFEHRGFSVEIARDGQDAIDKFPMERTPDLIMVDVEMPRVDGFELTSFLRARPELASVPIIMLTTRTGLAEKAYQAGVNVFMNKPCDSQALDNAITQVLPNIVLAGAV